MHYESLLEAETVEPCELQPGSTSVPSHCWGDYVLKLPVAKCVLAMVGSMGYVSLQHVTIFPGELQLQPEVLRCHLQGSLAGQGW